MIPTARPKTTGVLNTTYTCSGAGSSHISGAVTLAFSGGPGTSSSGDHDVGSWTITPSQGGITWNTGYTGTLSYIAGTLTITAKGLTDTGFAVNGKTD